VTFRDDDRLGLGWSGDPGTRRGDIALKSDKTGTSPVDHKALLLFLGLIICEFAILFGYKASFSGSILPTSLALPAGLQGIVPYFRYASDPIPQNVEAYITMYYFLSVIFLIGYVTISAVRRKKAVTIKSVVLLLAAILFVCVPWLCGWDLSRANMSQLHRGVILDHFLYLNAILLVTGVGCAAAFGLRRTGA
jgi:hypothetical protein